MPLRRLRVHVPGVDAKGQGQGTGKRRGIWLSILTSHHHSVNTMRAVISLTLLFVLGAASAVTGFIAPNALSSSMSRKAAVRSGCTLKSSKEREGWTFNPFDVNDLSPLDTLQRVGPGPLFIRLFQEKRYEEAVLEYMRKDGCDRPTAQRNMDKFFADPTGWVASKARERDLGEEQPDVNAPTGVMKRPVFSFFWASWCFYLFFIFFPTRIGELGGFHSSSLGSSGQLF